MPCVYDEDCLDFRIVLCVIVLLECFVGLFLLEIHELLILFVSIFHRILLTLDSLLYCIYTLEINGSPLSSKVFTTQLNAKNFAQLDCNCEAYFCKSVYDFFIYYNNINFLNRNTITDVMMQYDATSFTQ